MPTVLVSAGPCLAVTSNIIIIILLLELRLDDGASAKTTSESEGVCLLYRNS